jgi:hypothetical protein
MKITRIVTTQEPYPVCAISGKHAEYFDPFFKITRDDGGMVYVHYESLFELQANVKAPK